MQTIIENGLCIRPLRSADADSFAAAVRESAGSIGPWLPWCRADYSARDAQAWINQCGVRLNMGFSWDVGIFLDDCATLCGSVAINQIDHVHRSANLGYWVRSAMQRTGIAPRAVKLMARFGFETLRLTRVEIVTAADNVPSRKVAEKLGAAFEGIARNRLVVGGVPVSAAIYSLIPADMQDN